MVVLGMGGRGCIESLEACYSMISSPPSPPLSLTQKKCFSDFDTLIARTHACLQALCMFINIIFSVFFQGMVIVALNL